MRPRRDSGGGPDVELLISETVFRGHYRLDRYRLRHRRYAGGLSGELVREVSSEAMPWPCCSTIPSATPSS